VVIETGGGIAAFVRDAPAQAGGGRGFRMYYRDEQGNLTERSVLPLRYFEARDGREFLKAWCFLRNDERTFRVDRIERIVVEDPRRLGTVAAQAAGSDRRADTHSHVQAASGYTRAATAGGAALARQPGPGAAGSKASAAKPAPPKKHSRFFLAAAAAAALIIFTRGYFKEEEQGSYATPPRIHAFIAKTRTTPASHTAALAAAPAAALDAAPKPPASLAYNANLEARTARFSQATGVNSGELAGRYAAADIDKNELLSWAEIETFQRTLSLSCSYEANETALRPDEFFAAGGGDCEDWSLVTAGLLRFWGYRSYIGSLRSPDDRQGNAVCLVWSEEKPPRFVYYHFEESGTFNGTHVEAGFYIPVDYDTIGALTNAAGPDWKLERMYVPEKIYGAAM